MTRLTVLIPIVGPVVGKIDLLAWTLTPNVGNDGKTGILLFVWPLVIDVNPLGVVCSDGFGVVIGKDSRGINFGTVDDPFRANVDCCN